MNADIDFYRELLLQRNKEQEDYWQELTLFREQIAHSFNEHLRERWGENAPTLQYERDAPLDNSDNMAKQVLQDFMDLAAPPKKER